MRIAMLAPLIESVPPKTYGGTERVVAWLVEELARRGHAVTLFASGDSSVSVDLVPGCPRALRESGVGDTTALHLAMLGEAFRRADEFDLIHSHVDFCAFPFAGLVDTPVVHTLHGRLDLPWLGDVYARHPDLELVSISDAQRAPLGRTRFAATVYHGLPRELFQYDARGGDELLFLGRINAEKGPVLAIEAARRAGRRLRIAAKVDPVDREYFEREVRPRIDPQWVDFIGEVDDREKQELLGTSRALLLPIDWPEPFGIAFIEALACGTPIVTRPCGSAAEIVRPGVTGLLASDVDGLARAILAVDGLERSACRAEFEARFRVEHMVDAYEAVYAEVVARARDTEVVRAR